MWAGYKRSCGWPASVGCGRFLVCVSFAIASVLRLRSYRGVAEFTVCVCVCVCGGGGGGGREQNRTEFIDDENVYLNVLLSL